MDEVAQNSQLGIFNRGDHSEIGVAPGVVLDDPYSLNTVDVCPVGALTSSVFRFKQRAWNLKRSDSICGGCARGCNVNVDERSGVVYRLLPRDVLPASECLRDVVLRTLPYWYDVVAPQLMAGMNVLITAHGNSLRALLKHLEHVSDDDIADVNIPTGAPRRYQFDDRLDLVSAEYLGDAEAVAAAAAAVAAQAGTT